MRASTLLLLCVFLVLWHRIVIYMRGVLGSLSCRQKAKGRVKELLAGRETQEATSTFAETLRGDRLEEQGFGITTGKGDLTQANIISLSSACNQ